MRVEIKGIFYPDYSKELFLNCSDRFAQDNRTSLNSTKYLFNLLLSPLHPIKEIYNLALHT